MEKSFEYDMLDADRSHPRDDTVETLVAILFHSRES